MAFQPLTFTQRVESDTKHWLSQARFFRDYAAHSNGTIIIDIKLGAANAGALLDLCKQVEDVQKRSQITSLLQKAQKKFAQAERINQYFQKRDTDAAHPRVEQLIAKLTRMKEPSPKTLVNDDAFFDKQYKSRQQLDQILDSNTKPASIAAYKKARSMLEELDMQLLQKSTQFAYFSDLNNDPHSVLDVTYCHYYTPCSVPKEAQKLASAGWAMNYLDCVTKFADIRLKHFMPEGNIYEWHQRMATYLEKQSPRPSALSIEDLNVKIYGGRLSPIPFTETMLAERPELKEGLGYPAEPTAREIINKLETLIELKNAHKLKSMGAFIGIGPQVVAIVFHSTGRISLYDPCGDGLRPQSYEVNFGNVKHAAHFLRDLTDQIGTKEPVTLKPYCSSGSFKSGKFSIACSSIRGLSPELLAMPGISGAPNMTYTMPSNNLPSSSAFLASQGNFQLPGVMDLNSSPHEVAPSESSSESESDVSESEDEEEPQVDTFAMQRVIEHLSLSTLEGLSPAFLAFHGLPLPLMDRLYFHLSQIQNKETADRVQGIDRVFGEKPSFNTEGLSTPEQRLRAAQRTYVEMLLKELQKRTQGGSVDGLVQLLEQLEGLQLHTNDLPKGQTNAAHALFDKCLQIYEKLRKEYPGMGDPLHKKFQEEFGRRYFRGDFYPMGPVGNIKVQAIEDLIKDFNAAWGI